MTERSGPWNGVATGDATEAPYDAPTDFAKMIRVLTNSDGLANAGFVVDGLGSELVPTGAAGAVDIASGGASVYGTAYWSDGAVSTAIPTPAASTRIDRLVLRKDWAAQTVRITRIAGVEGGGAPALVQIPDTTWDFPIAQASITTGGVITVTDQRAILTAGVGGGFTDPLFLVLI